MLVPKKSIKKAIMIDFLINFIFLKVNPMIFSTTPDVPGRQISENLGVVAGNVVQSKHVGRDLMAGLKGIIGGEISGYTEMLADARDVAIERMVTEAQKRGADAIVNIRFTTSAIMANASEMLAYGTAVKLIESSK